MNIQEASIKQLTASFERQKAAFSQQPNPSLALRLERIGQLKAMLLANRKNFHAALAEDFGSHPARLVDSMETGPVIGRVDFFTENLAVWLQPQEIALGPAHGSSRGEILQVPKGVNGVIAPWNFPVESSLVMCTDILAAGNRVIVKPSELAPATAQVIEESVAEFFDPEVLTIVQGGADLGQAFASMPWDHLTFTGSPRVGRLVMQAAAENLTPVTLELGGKNPALFADDGVTEDMVKLFLSFRTLKSGQVCTSPDYVLVPTDQLEQWVRLAKEIWSNAYSNYVGHPDMVGIINAAHFERVVGYLQEARERGVRVEGLNEDQPDSNNRQIPLTLIIDPPEDLACMNDEVFGPVVPVIPYQSIDEAMQSINTGPSPLGSYIVTHDQDLAQRFVHTVRSGGAAVNCFGLQGGHVALPFGGFGRSGQGCHSGREGFLGYCHTKSVFYGASDSPVHKHLEPPLNITR